MNLRKSSQSNNPEVKQPWLVPLKEITLSVDDELGRGGFASVYLGTYNQQQVACKKFHIASMREVAKRDFIKEVETIYKLDHPNVIKVLGACMEPKNFIILLEYAAGGSLYHILGNPDIDLDWKAKVNILRGVASGLAYLHEHNIIHRDLKV